MVYDYVIVGGGSAGCVLAARLSEDPSVTVCLIEAGGGGNDIFIRAPALIPAMISGRPRINNYAYHTVPQPGLNGRRGFQPRGRGLGGSSAINAMLYVRGHPRDYDEWAELGAEGWAWDDVRPWFLRVEGNARGGDAWHGGDGPLQVSEQSAPRRISRAFVDACAEVQIPRNDDFNGPEQAGAGLYQVKQFRDGPQKGERCSAAAAYLFPALARPNLTVLTRTRAERLLVEGNRAVGVQVRRRGRRRRIDARSEVILSGGAFNSPHLLLLSGIGPEDELAAHGIAPVHVLPGVGQNLQDHLNYTIIHRSLRRDVVGLNPRGLARLGRAAGTWRKTGEGLFATPYAEAGAFVPSAPGLDRPDLQLHFVIGIEDDHMRRLHLADGYSCHVCGLRPKSRGSVGLTSRNPADPPRIDPAFLNHPDDLDTLMRGARIVERVLGAQALAPWRGARLYPHDGSDAALQADIRAHADSIYHPVGTCRMGTDDMAVVDPQLRVRGMAGLRVVDASVMPRVIGGNTGAPAMMIGERAAAMIAQARKG
ncbi:GMC family oxidoreductase [Rhodovulum adriaticum]|uniref:Choline dehydrogenase-like flavoprotein n=1 Tax=Rhodovulum adriaticum TaxID=35804 RepID=A0A4R2NK19_RHOAD|nr:GMC family oxidoreductase N-terminal domain-containing protein [Rhodovulum adriaticum]MBK1635546.1 glucose-methanol-choline oxidoreductase [Rhodovulum adriaticum]TCP21820.1 choline dehydrogenase-like flavoprotein [Rhodovulum adriaticum]